MYETFLKEINRGFLELGIRNGDSLYIASDITRILIKAQKEFGVNNTKARDEFLWVIIRCLQDVVGYGGNLLFPVFSWAFCRGETFHRKTSLGEVGAFNNWILQHCNVFRRTAHPIYSFLVWGKDADKLAGMENTDAWGEDSPFAWLHNNKAKMLLLDVSLQRGFTFMHYVEERAKVPYRYMKNFRGEYVDDDGESTARNYRMYVRDLGIIAQEYLPEFFLEDAGVMQGVKCEGFEMKIIDLAQAYSVVYQDLRNNGGAHCYRFEDYVIDWEKRATHKDELGNG